MNHVEFAKKTQEIGYVWHFYYLWHLACYCRRHIPVLVMVLHILSMFLNILSRFLKSFHGYTEPSRNWPSSSRVNLETYYFTGISRNFTSTSRAHVLGHHLGSVYIQGFYQNHSKKYVSSSTQYTAAHESSSSIFPAKQVMPRGGPPLNLVFPYVEAKLALWRPGSWYIHDHICKYCRFTKIYSGSPDLLTTSYNILHRLTASFQ